MGKLGKNRKFSQNVLTIFSSIVKRKKSEPEVWWTSHLTGARRILPYFLVKLPYLSSVIYFNYFGLTPLGNAE